MKRSFDKNPVLCPDCGNEMLSDVMYSFQAQNVVDRLIAPHVLRKGYFRPRRRAA